MKRLYLVRHAKSSWSYSDAKDVDRPLKERGIRDAYLMSSLISQKYEKPEVMLTSMANRALHTAVIFAENWHFPYSEVLLKRSLYMHHTRKVLDTLAEQDDSVKHMMMVSHNPLINDLANKLQSDMKIDNVPTCGIVGIEFDQDSWADLSEGKLLFFEYPKNYR